MPATRAVLLPGTGSDETFVESVFAGPLAAAGVDALMPPPPAGAKLAVGFLTLLDSLADGAGVPCGHTPCVLWGHSPHTPTGSKPPDRCVLWGHSPHTPTGGKPPDRRVLWGHSPHAPTGGKPPDPLKLIVGGISFGAHLAAEWAVRNPDRCAGLLLALPAWHGSPDGAPASLAAKASADLVETQGIEAALSLSTAGVVPWLAAELTRSWRRHGDDLAVSLRVAANRAAPTLSALRRLAVPTGIAACVDDPVHPAGVAHAWAAALPRASVSETTLAALGADRASLGRAAVAALKRAAGPAAPRCAGRPRPAG